MEQFSGFERKGSIWLTQDGHWVFHTQQLQIFDKILMEKYTTISVPFVLGFYNYARCLKNFYFHFFIKLAEFFLLLLPFIIFLSSGAGIISW